MSRRTLARGKPGSSRPLSEAGPVSDADTLATGRPGSRRPLSEAKPAETQQNSVRSANPHATRKLSSGREP